MSNDSQLAVLPPAALSRNVDNATWNALSEIYGDPSPEKLGLVLDYCRARKMDPLKKPVHIVPVWSKKRNCMVETIWPAISEVRATAMRTGQYAGRDATLFGPNIKRRLGAAEVEYPEWAQVTVYRIVVGHKCAFVGPKVEWIEAYARAKSNELTPNSMWAKRPGGQLDKCAEAAALRAAFPEETGGMPTSDEMHGQSIDIDADEEPTPAPERRAPPERSKKGLAAVQENSEKPADATVEIAATEVAQKTPETPAPTPASAKTETARKELKDGEKLVAICSVESFKTFTANVSGVITPGVKAVVKGDFDGEVNHLGGAKQEGDKYVADPLWNVERPMKLSLAGKKTGSGAVKIIVESISEVSPAIPVAEEI